MSSRGARCGCWSRTWSRLRAALSHAALLLALAAYTAAGGLVFRALEGPAEAERLQALQAAVLEGRRGLLAALSNATAEAERATLALRLHEYEAVVHEASRGGVEVPALTGTPSAKTPPRWTLLQGVFFASTVLTTIGYGNIAPVTLWGRVFCLTFALVGIPLTLSVIADLGVLLASAVSAIPCWGWCRTWWSLDEGGKATMWRNGLLALAAVLLLSVYLAAGAAMFTLWEDGWDFFDGFYFCFITMTTIGFGDLVPRHPSYSLLCTLYILVGLALTSTIIELVRRQYASSWRRLQMALSESGPVLGDALRRLGNVSDVHLKGILAAVSLARLVPQGVARDGAAALTAPGQDGAEAKRQWEEAVAKVLHEMQEKARKEAEAAREQDERERERELLEQRRRGSQPEKRRRRPQSTGRLIEIVIYETTV
ncbi:TWiK family of potassium channels protein 7 [Frankliniella fusca]|uniref:TWiK family of potassium channels protein 7 n=1 Tax=Frankliniella fusca TaxID=407009 RepID=A0AAE1HPC4_9NEOP|nr:TWiK family of potassium channels protein 7 [Frankliniella fusca]